jgi:aspartate/methionine/tyrosine aminotransferase
MSLDTDGRVIRVDTLSKCVAPGMRLGWISATQSVLSVLKQPLVSSTMGPSGHAVMSAHALTQAWGHAGFHAHTQALQVCLRLLTCLRYILCCLPLCICHGEQVASFLVCMFFATTAVQDATIIPKIAVHDSRFCAAGALLRIAAGAVRSFGGTLQGPGRMDSTTCWHVCLDEAQRL